MDFLRHWLFIAIGKETFRVENLIPVAEAAILFSLQGWPGLWCFYVMQAVATWLLLITSFCVHRSEHAWSEGDPDGELDFAAHTLITTTDHSDGAPLPVSLLCFALLDSHVLHHLFPTVDYSRHGEIRDILETTCKEYNVTYRKYRFVDLLGSTWRKFDIRFPKSLF